MQPVWQTREALLLCVGPDEHGEKLVRAAARMAAQLDVPWHCVYVETPALQRLPGRGAPAHPARAQAGRRSWAPTPRRWPGRTLADAIVKYAREHNLSRVVLGRDTGAAAGRGSARWPRRSAQLGNDLDVIQIALPARGARAAGAPPTPATKRSAPPRPGAATPGAPRSAPLPRWLATPLLDVFELTNIVMLFLLAVVFVALRYGRGPAVLAAFLTVAAFDFFFVPPRFTFSVSDAQYLLTFGVMLVVALVIGQLTAGLKFQARVATLREDARARAVRDVARPVRRAAGRAGRRDRARAS